MPRGRPLPPLTVSPDTREELASMARSRSLPAGLVSRARIVLLCAEGLDNKTVAERVGVSRQTVGRWRERFRPGASWACTTNTGRAGRAPSRTTPS